MPYDADTDPYLDPTTGILRNLLGITNQADLDDAEADLSAAVLTTLPEHPIPGDFDLKHLQTVHRTIFGSLYDWAGKLRTVELAKGQTRFANPEFLEQAATEVFANLRAEGFLKGLPKDEYAKHLAHHYSEINILHPFREGNGRTQRAFFTLLTAEAGYWLRWEAIDRDENINVMIAAYDGDESGLAAMLAALLIPLT